MRAVSAGDFELVDTLTEDIDRMAELVEQYEDSGLDTTDASIIAMAERLGVTELATRNRRHFAFVRPRHVPAFTLLPEHLASV